MEGDARAVLLALARMFDELGVDYLIAGSAASSIQGTPRATRDVDFVADLREEHVPGLVRALGPAYYCDEGAVRDAIGHRSSFNVIDLDSMFKADVFVLPDDRHARTEMSRRQLLPLSREAGAPTVYVCSAEDTVLTKLAWYRLGREASDRQWSDVVGVLQVRGEALDIGYMREWAERMGIADLLDRAMATAVT